MENQAHLSTWYTYQKAWSDVSSAERQGLLVDSVTDGCVYTDPSTQCNGRAELMAFIEQFRQSMPGTSFKNNTFTHHHAQSLATWVLQDAQGNELQPGMSYARFGEDGRLTLVTGFF